MNTENPTRTNGSTKETFEAGRTRVAQGLHRAADVVRNQAERLPEGQRLSGVARTTADRMSRVADYTQSHDLNDMWRDIETVVKSHPAESITAALFLGILVGRSFRRSDSYEY